MSRIGFNFRSSESFAQDSSGEVFVGGEQYSPSRGYGWSGEVSGLRNRNSSFDRRLAGISFTSRPLNWRYDLPNGPGTYRVWAGFYDLSFTNPANWYLQDGPEIVSEISGSVDRLGLDATGTALTTAEWSATDGGGFIEHTFISDHFILQRSPVGGNNVVSHLAFEFVSSPVAGNSSIAFDDMVSVSSATLKPIATSSTSIVFDGIATGSQGSTSGNAQSTTQLDGMTTTATASSNSVASSTTTFGDMISVASGSADSTAGLSCVFEDMAVSSSGGSPVNGVSVVFADMIAMAIATADEAITEPPVCGVSAIVSAPRRQGRLIGSSPSSSSITPAKNYKPESTN